MKIRNGFVSNSSSSSFIIGVAKVSDVSEAQAFLATLKMNGYDARIEKVSELDRVYDAKLSGDTVSVESFMYTDVSVSGVTPEDHVLVMYHQEGDDYSFWDEDGEYYDYDIDLDFFEETAIALYHAIIAGSNGLEAGQATYGAGRDG